MRSPFIKKMQYNWTWHYGARVTNHISFPILKLHFIFFTLFFRLFFFFLGITAAPACAVAMVTSSNHKKRSCHRRLLFHQSCFFLLFFFVITGVPASAVTMVTERLPPRPHSPLPGSWPLTRRSVTATTLNYNLATPFPARSRSRSHMPIPSHRKRKILVCAVCKVHEVDFDWTV